MAPAFFGPAVITNAGETVSSGMGWLWDGICRVVRPGLALATLLLLALPEAATSQITPDPYNGFYWTQIGSTISITNYDGPGGAVVIPATIAGLPVTSIGEVAFVEYYSMTSVTIPTNVTSIGDAAFNTCINLTSVTIPNSVTSIEDSEFDSCGNLSSVTIPGSVTNIGGFAFNYCTSLTSVTIPGSLTSIGGYAFANCSSLTNACFGGNAPTSFATLVFVNTPVPVIFYVSGATGWGTNYESIPIETCAQCSQTTPDPFDGFSWTQIGDAISITNYSGAGGAIVIPATIGSLSVTSIGNLAFEGNSSLTSVTIPSGVTNIGAFAFDTCTNLAGVTLPNGLTSIGNEAFSDCTGLSSVTIPNSVTSIGNFGFSDCTSLGSVTLPNGLTSLGNAVFIGCTNLTSIIIPGSVTSIGPNTFNDCTGLGSVRIPSSITNIGPAAFGNCTNLTNVYFGGNAPTSSGTPVFINDPVSVIYYNPAATGWGSTFQGIPTSACAPCGQTTTNLYDGFYWTQIGESISITNYVGGGGAIAIPTNIVGLPVTSIGAGAFEGHTNLTSVTIPPGVTSIGNFAFGSCYGLTNVTIGNTVTSIGYGAFNFCQSLAGVTIPGSVTSIGGDAFLECSGLTTVTIPGSVTSIGGGAFDACTGVTTATIGNGVASIGNFAFVSCTSLTNITIPASVTSIGTNAFGDCYDLTNACFEGNAPATIANPLFGGDPLTLIYYVSGATGWGTNFQGIPTAPCAQCSQTTADPFDGFYWTQIGSAVSITGYDGAGGAVVIPTTIAGLPVTGIEEYVFQAFSGLTSITIPDAVTNIADKAFHECYSLITITVNPNNPAYSSGAGVLFDKSQTTLILYPAASAETSYAIPGTVTIIEDYAFSVSTNLTSVTIPNGVTTIGESAFYDCYRLTSLTIPTSVTSIGADGFQATSLTSITIPGSVTSIGDGAFNGCQGLKTATIGNGVTSIGEDAFTGCVILTNITIPASVTTIGNAFRDCYALTNVCFEGNEPASFGNFVFVSDPVTVIYYVSGATGWGPSFQGIPTAPCAQCGLQNIGALQVTITPDCAASAGAQWRVDGGAFQNSGAILTNLPGGNHTVSFSTNIGWITPINQTVLVTANTTNIAAGYYVETSIAGAITWVHGGADFKWSNPANWDSNRAPINSDIVLIPHTDETNCLLDVDATVAGLVIGECAGGGSDGLNLNGHTLEVDGPITVISNAVFAVSSGILMGNSNTLISGVFGWTSGTLAGTLTMASNSVLNINAPTGGKYFSDCFLTNYGTVNWSGDQLNVDAGAFAFIYNYGLWNAQDDQAIYGGAGTVFNNYGTFRKSGGTNTLYTDFTGEVLFNQSDGVLDVQQGVLLLQGSGNFTGGYVTTNGTGVTDLNIGSFNINGTTTGSNVLEEASLFGTNVINGALTWQNGSWYGMVTVSSNSVVIINGNNSGKTFNGCIVTNYGAVNWSVGPLYGVNAVIYNYGLWNAQDDQELYWSSGGDTVFNNYGIFRKSGGANPMYTQFPGSVVFNQRGGVLDVQQGVLLLQGGGNFTGGYITTNGTGMINLNIGSFTINGATTSSNVFEEAALVGTNVIKGALTWQNGSWSGVVTVSSNSVVIINGNNSGKTFNGCILTNYGTVNWSGGPLYGASAAIYNYGLWNAQDDQELYWSSGGDTVFNNYGTFRKSGGTSPMFTLFPAQIQFIQSGGVLDVQRGELMLQGAYSLTNGTLNFGINNVTDYGQLLIGTLELGGALSANVSGNFAPAIGDRFPVVSSSSLSGIFSRTNLPSGISVTYSNNTVFLNVTSPVPVLVVSPPVNGTPVIGTNVVFQFATASNQSYTVQANDDLATTNWVLYTNIVGNGSVSQFQAPVTAIQLFFRVSQP